MATLIKSTDFVGRYSVSVDMSSLPKLNDFIDEVEEQVMSELLGSTLAGLFLADASANGGVPLDPNYLLIYNTLQLSNCYEENFSNGIKKMLISMVYYKVQTDENNISTNLGLKNVKSTVSESARVDGLRMANIYNNGVRNYQVIQQYICLNRSDFPDYSGVTKEFAHPF